MADFLDDLYDARWHKLRRLKQYTEVLTASVVSSYSNVFKQDLAHSDERVAILNYMFEETWSFSQKRGLYLSLFEIFLVHTVEHFGTIYNGSKKK